MATEQYIPSRLPLLEMYLAYFRNSYGRTVKYSAEKYRKPIFPGLLISYTTKHNTISSSLVYRYLQVYLPPTLPNTAPLAAAPHVDI